MVSKETKTYRGFIIEAEPYGGAPASMKWQYVHEDYDGPGGPDEPGDPRHGNAPTEQACRDEIDEALAEGWWE